MNDEKKRKSTRTSRRTTMQRCVALWLLMALLFPTLAACTGGGEGSSESESNSEATESHSDQNGSEQEDSMTLYVTPNATGGNGSEGAPFGTVKEAYTEAVKLINEKTAKDIVICLTAGQHVLSEEILIDGDAITTRGYSIRFEGDAALPEETEVTSNVDIPGSYFQKVDGKDYYMYQLPETARKEDGSFPLFRDLYVNGEALSLASSEREQYRMYYDTCKSAAGFNVDPDARTLFVEYEAVEGVEVDENCNVVGDLELWIKTEWQVHALHVEKILFNETSHLISESSGAPLVGVVIRASEWSVFKSGYYGDLRTCPYWMANNRRYISRGEFYYDHNNGIIYCNPNDRIEKVTVSYPQTERLFHLQNAKNISFANMYLHGVTVNIITTFGYVTGQGGYIKIKDPATGKQFGFLPFGAIYGKNVSNITVEGCTISNVGDDAINFRGAVSNITIKDCTMENIGGAAIRFGENTSTYDALIYNRDITVTNNYIRNTGTIYTSNPGILIASVLNLELTHNHILESCYSGISVGWSWSSQWNNYAADSKGFVNVKNANIAYNYIEDFMTGMADGGAIYTLGGNASEKTETYLNAIHDNLVVLKSNAGRYERGFTVFYHDQGSSHWHDYSNMLLIEENMREPNTTYISYSGITPCHRSKTEELYVVGYPAADLTEKRTAYNLFIGRDPGWYYYTQDESGEITKHLANDGFEVYYDESTGAYDFCLPFYESKIVTKAGAPLCYEELFTRVENCYLFTSYDDPRITDEAQSRMESIYENAGCDFFGKNWDFGEMPPYSGRKK